MRQIMVALMAMVMLFNLAWAKYCSSCVPLFQAQTPAGQAKAAYRWLIDHINDHQSKKTVLPDIFSPDVRFDLNGQILADHREDMVTVAQVAYPEMERVNAHLEYSVVDKEQVVLVFNLVLRHRQLFFLDRCMALFRFQNRRIQSWRQVCYRSAP